MAATRRPRFIASCLVQITLPLAVIACLLNPSTRRWVFAGMAAGYGLALFSYAVASADPKFSTSQATAYTSD